MARGVEVTVIIRNINLNDDIDSIVVPRRPDGEHYRYEMICDQGLTRLYDDSITGFLSHIIPGYTRFDEKERLTARIRHAIEVQAILQSQLNLFFREIIQTPDEEALLNSPKHVQPTIESWGCQVPLVLIDAFYFPYSLAPRPYSEIEDVAMPSNIWWLRPAEDEMTYLISLHDISFIDFNIAKEELI